MWNCVEEVLYDRESQPIINYNAVKILDKWTGLFYVYGGVRWPQNKNANSPTCKPTADFFCYKSYPEPRWQNYSNSMREDDSLFSPFEETLARPERIKLDLPNLGSLPTLRDPIGTIVRDNTGARTSYLLILGDPFGKGYKQYGHPVLLCINITLNTWRFINLKGSEKIPGGRAHASMIVTGEMRSATSDLYLCVFGGVKEETIDERSATYLDTFSVANLTKGLWTVPNGKIPESIGPLGMYPGLAKFRTKDEERDQILILKGALDDRNRISRSKASFSRAFLFNPRTRLNHFAEIDINTASPFPHPAKSFIIQPCEAAASNGACKEFVVVTCGRQRPLNKFPSWPAGSSSNSIYVRPDVKIWIAEICELEVKDNLESERRPAKEADAEYTVEDESSSEDDSSTSESDGTSLMYKNRAAKQWKVQSQKATRSGAQIVRKTEKLLVWRNLSAGRAKQYLESLSETFRIESMFLSGEVTTRFDPSTCSYNHPDVPRLILLGSDHAYLGEVFSDIYNAVGTISLHSLVEASGEDAEAEYLSILDDSSISAESTQYASSADEVYSFEQYDDDLSLSGASSIGEHNQIALERSFPEPIDDEMPPVVDNIPEFTFAHAEDSDDENLEPSLILCQSGTDPFLLPQEPEREAGAIADFEIECIVQEVMSVPDPSEDDWHMTENDDVKMDDAVQTPLRITV